MKILITGVYGIVGSYLCNKLKEKHEIVGIGRKENYDECHKYYSCDITDENAIKEVLTKNKDIDIIIHCAALAHNKGNDLSKDRFIQINYQATKYLIDLSSEELNLKNFIFISTISVYGEKLEKTEYTEEDECEPRSPYALAKKLSEEYIKENYKRNYTILRLAPVYSNTFKLNIERRTLLKGRPYVVGNGAQKLSLCNIKNIYESINYIVNNTTTEKNNIYNISDSKSYSYNDLVEHIGATRRLRMPKVAFKALYLINKVSIKKQFIHENSIKLVSDNIYPSTKMSKNKAMKFDIKDVGN